MRIMFRGGAVGAAVTVLAVGGASPALAASGWQPTGSMLAERGAHQAALLDDGRVLVASGMNDAGQVPAAELYDPGEGTWSPAAPPLVPRHSATATKLSDGRVLLVGGFARTGITRRAELYDPVANTWTATGLMATARLNHRAVRLSDGRVLVTGGSDEAINAAASAELYDPATGTWTTVASMATERENHQAVRMADGRVLVTGGMSQRPTWAIHATSEIYDPSTDAWTPAASMTTARTQFAGGLLADGTVLATNGLTSSGAFVPAAERFDPVTGTWAAAGSVNVQGNVASGVTLRDGRFLLTLDGTPTTPLYDPTAAASEAWSERYAFAAWRAMPSLTLLDDGRVLIAGGVAGGAQLHSAEIFTPPTERGATGGDFGSVGHGDEAEQDVTLSNDGGNPLWIDGVTLSGADASAFSVVADGCTGQTLEPTERCVVRVRFAPAAVRVRSAELAVDDNAETSPAVTLTGTGDRRADPPVDPPVDPPADPPAGPPVGPPLDPIRIAPNPYAPLSPAPTPPAQCTRRFVTLAGIAPTSSSGKRLKLTGVATTSLAGRSVRIERNGRLVGTTTVASDGRIDATVTASGSDRARRTDRYRLVVPDGARSRALKAQRRVSAERTTRQANGTVVVTGRVRDVRRPIALTLRSDAVCGPKTRKAVARTDRGGRFRVTLPAPVTGSPAQIHRLWWGTRSVSLPVVVTSTS